MSSRSRTEGSVGRELAENDLEWPRLDLIGGGDPPDQLLPDRPHGSSPSAHNAGEGTATDPEPAEPNRRMQIVWLRRDESALDAFGSESGVRDVPTSSPAAATHESAIAAASAPIQQSAIAPAADTATDVEPAEPDRGMQIVWLPRDESALDAFASESGVLDVPTSSPAPAAHQQAIASATAPIHVDVRRGTLRRPGSARRQAFIYAALAIGVTCGSMAGVYLRRNPAGRAATLFPVHDVTDQVALTVPASGTASPPETASPAETASLPETASPSENSQPATASVNEPLAPPRDEPPVARGAVARGNELRRESSLPDVKTIPNSTPASARQETPAPAPSRAANTNPSPPLVVASPPQMPPTRIDPVATPANIASTREKSDGSDVPSTPQAMPVAVRAPVEAPVVPPAPATPVTPLAATSLTTERVRGREAAPEVVAVADEQRIAALLKRFTDAYTQLNAPAAKAVWPSVDGRALSRAFDALESQSIAFDDCTVHVSGAEARAACVGNLTYVPKIGRRSARTVNQHWNFVMKRNSEGWAITDAQMR